jgi:hypothetical protein
LSQEGYHFTDFSPSGRVIELNARLGFRSLETTTALVPNLPWPSWPGRATITSDPSVIERTLTGRQLELYRDHAATAAARHLLLTAGDEWCYVAFRKNRRARLPRLAFLLHVSHPEVFRRLARPLARHLLLHHGAIAMVAQDRVVEFRPRLSLTHRSGPRMFRSPHLQPAQIDYFYSELFSLKW